MRNLVREIRAGVPIPTALLAFWLRQGTQILLFVCALLVLWLVSLTIHQQQTTAQNCRALNELVRYDQRFVAHFGVPYTPHVRACEGHPH